MLLNFLQFSIIQNPDEVFFIYSCSAPNQRHHMEIVVKAVAFAHQECQERPVCLVPRVFRDCRARKEEAWVQRETKVTKEILESKAPQALRDIMDQQDRMAQQDLRDHLDHRGRKATKESKAIQANKAFLALKALKDLREHLDETGNNVFFKVWAKQKMLAWSR